MDLFNDFKADIEFVGRTKYYISKVANDLKEQDLEQMTKDIVEMI